MDRQEQANQKRRKTANAKDERIAELERELQAARAQLSEQQDRANGLAAQLNKLKTDTRSFLYSLLLQIDYHYQSDNRNRTDPSFLVDWVNLLIVCGHFTDLPSIPRDFVLESIIEIEGDSDLEWDVVPEYLRSDPIIAREAFLKSLCRYDDIVHVVDDAHEIVRQGLKEGCCYFDELPDTLLQDSDFCLSVVDDYPLHGLTNWVELRGDRAVWQRIVDSPHRGWTRRADEVPKLFELNLVADSIRSDREFVLDICQKYPRTLAFVNEEHGLEFVAEVLQKNAGALPYVSSEFVERFKAVVVAELINFRKVAFHPVDSEVLGEIAESFNELGRKLTSHLINDPDVVNAWFNAGLPLFDIDFGETPVDTDPFSRFKGDKDKLLGVVKKCPDRYWRYLSLMFASEELRGNNDFMMDVFEIDGSLYECSLPELRADNLELVVAALGSETVTRWGWADDIINRSPYQSMSDLIRAVRERLELHNAFVNPFLCCLHFSSDASMTERVGCSLFMLNMEKVKLEIAEFVGLPMGRFLRNSRRTLKKFGN